MESTSPPPTPAQKKSIGKILLAGWHLLKLINEILDLAVIEAGKSSLSLPRCIRIASVLSRKYRTMMEPEALKRGIRMTFSKADPLIFVWADSTVKQIISNHSFPTRSNTTRRRGSVVVDCRDPHGTIRIQVEDNGRVDSGESFTTCSRYLRRLPDHPPATRPGIDLGVVTSDWRN